MPRRKQWWDLAKMTAIKIGPNRIVAMTVRAMNTGKIDVEVVIARNKLKKIGSSGGGRILDVTKVITRHKGRIRR